VYIIQSLFAKQSYVFIQLNLSNTEIEGTKQTVCIRQVCLTRGLAVITLSMKNEGMYLYNMV
jgi:hypothetical protein